jgi:putative glutamine amidotransferase
MSAASAFAPAPLIAVTTSELREGRAAPPTPQGEPAQQEMALGMKYLRAIEMAGGVPVVVPPLRDETLLGALLDRVSGLCLTGGPDLDPIIYGACRHEMIGPTWQDLDECELALARLADARHLPVLGICRGLQAINIARGGTLHQHLPDLHRGRINHRQTEPGHQPTHWVTLDGPSRLAEILGRRRIRVNSFHHQATDVLGRDLRVTSRAGDGTIESVEATDREFLLGVQWHAECLIAHPGQRALFRSLIDAAQRYEASPDLLQRAA